MDDLKTAFILKLKKTLSVEETIIETLPKMIAGATNPALKAGLSEHLEETRGQRDRLVEVLSRHSESGAEEDVAFTTLVSEADKELAKITDPHVKDAVIIAAAQGVEHFEIARYNTLISWADALELSDCKADLKATLAEEEHADKQMATLGSGGIFSSGVNDSAAEQ